MHAVICYLIIIYVRLFHIVSFLWIKYGQRRGIKNPNRIGLAKNITVCNRSFNKSLSQCGNSNLEHNFWSIFSDYRIRVVHPNKSRVLACSRRDNSKPLHYKRSPYHVVTDNKDVKGSRFECPYFNRNWLIDYKCITHTCYERIKA